MLVTDHISRLLHHLKMQEYIFGWSNVSSCMLSSSKRITNAALLSARHHMPSSHVLMMRYEQQTKKAACEAADSLASTAICPAWLLILASSTAIGQSFCSWIIFKLWTANAFSRTTRHNANCMWFEQPGEPPIEPLILWEPEEGQGGKCVEVDTMLCKWLRPHQREGVQFMFECVAGLRQFGGQGTLPAQICPEWSKLSCKQPVCKLKTHPPGYMHAAYEHLMPAFCSTQNSCSYKAEGSCMVQGVFLQMIWAWGRHCKVGLTADSYVISIDKVSCLCASHWHHRLPCLYCRAW